MIRNLAAFFVTLALFSAGCSEETPQTSADSGQRPAAAATPTIGDLSSPAADAGADTDASQRDEAAAIGAAASELEWDALIPDDYQPDKLMSDLNIDELSDDDPRAEEVMEKLRALWDEAPVREDLDGAAVKLPGFVVPVEADAKETTGFLLVPYYGACVHVPPPPANQTVYVISETGKGARPELFDVVWVSGTMSVKRVENDIAEAGYTLYATQIEPYE
jgi:hypothetical protein